MLPISYLVCFNISFEQKFFATKYKEFFMPVSSNYSSYTSNGSSATIDVGQKSKSNFEEKMLQNVLAYYNSNTLTTNNSSLSLSA
jgi:hypothetical protein